MRLLHLIASADPADGGPIAGILQQCRSFGENAVCEIACLDAADAPFLTESPVTIHALGTGRYGGGPKSKIARFRFTPRLVPWLRKNAGHYDLIIVNGLWSYASAGASLILPALTTPYAVYPHGMIDPWFRKAYPVKHWLKQIFWTAFEGRLTRHAGAVLFTTEDEMALAQGQFRGAAYRPLVAGYGIGDVPDRPAAQIEAFKTRVPTVGDRPYMLFLGRIHPKKGCDLLIRAWVAAATQRPDLQLVIAGPDQIGWAADLRDLAGQIGVDRAIHWPGLLDGPAKWGAFRGAEAFVLPSHQENFGVAVAEALACGTPVLISDRVNIWRVVKNAGGGLVEPDDLAGTSSLLLSFLALDARSRAEMRSAARQCFIDNFDLGTSADRLLALYRDLARSAM